MIEGLLAVLTFCTALGCGLMAGVFFAFSAFVMNGLARLPPAQGIATMQAINVAAITALFMAALFGTAAACVLLAVIALTMWHRLGAVHLLVGSLLYLVGTIVVTVVFNVPRNKALAGVDATSAAGTPLWTGYLSSWTRWNHVRTAAALAAGAFLTIAFCLLRAG